MSKKKDGDNKKADLLSHQQKKTADPAKTSSQPVEAAQNDTKTKSDFAKPKKRKKVFLAVGISVVVIAALVAVLVIVLNMNSELTAAKLINEYAKDKPYIQNIIEEDDPDGIAGTDNQYASKSSWDDSRLGDIVEEHAGTVEVFKNEKDAALREWYLNKVPEKCAQYISAQKFGKEFSKQVCGNLSYGVLYRNKTVVLRLSGAYSEEQISEYKSGFNSLIKKYNISETDIPSDEEVENIKKEKEEDLELFSSSQEKEMEAGFDDMAKDMDSSINDALISLDETDLSNLKENLEYLKTIPYFSDKIAAWEEKVAEVANKIAQSKAAAKAAKTRTFSAGKYTVGKDIDAGTYNITAVSGSGNLFVYNISGRSTINEIMSPEDSRFYIANYKNAYLGSGYEIEILSTLVLRFEIAD